MSFECSLLIGQILRHSDWLNNSKPTWEFSLLLYFSFVDGLSRPKIRRIWHLHRINYVITDDVIIYIVTSYDVIQRLDSLSCHRHHKQLRALFCQLQKAIKFYWPIRTLEKTYRCEVWKSSRWMEIVKLEFFIEQRLDFIQIVWASYDFTGFHLITLRQSNYESVT